jgi:flagellar L-ring protein precursor FlgH
MGERIVSSEGEMRRRLGPAGSGWSAATAADGAIGRPRSWRALSMTALPLICLGLGTSLLAGCGGLSRLAEVGRPPAMTPTADPTKDPKWRPITTPTPAPLPWPQEANALWRPGARAFFKDQRAAQVGDIITVLVRMNDSANLINNTTAQRTGTESAGLPNLFGLESIVPKTVNMSSLVSSSSTNSNIASGQIQRNEAVTLRLAGIVTQVLPNGNLVVAARQQFMVNSELRDLMVTGIVRPQDIGSDNTVPHDRMAEARISYGGRGNLTDLQRERWGSQMMDIIMPF